MAKYASLDILEDASVLDTRHKRQVYLSWNLVRFKIFYYYPELVDEEYHKTLKIEDAQYDKLKAEYLALCTSLMVDNTIVGTAMQEVDFDKSIVKATLKYIGCEGYEAKVSEIEKQLKEDAKATKTFETDEKKALIQDNEDYNWGV